MWKAAGLSGVLGWTLTGMTVMVEATWVDVVEVLLLLAVLGLQVRARFDRAQARVVARDTKSEASQAAVEARSAAGASERVLRRIDVTGAGTAGTAERIEAVVSPPVEDSEEPPR